MPEIPELPKDILNYLGNLIKPKKYTLINKFCRDLYFRKNGATIRFANYYPSYDLLTKYKVTILEKFDDCSARELRQKIGDVERFAKNVIKIKCNCSAEIYDTLVDIFPNLVEFNGIVDVYGKSSQKNLFHKKIPGVIISWKTVFTDKRVNTLINMGYNFSINSMRKVEEIPKNNVVILHLHGENQVNIDQYPNLKKLYIHYTCTKTDPLIDAIKKHKNIKKIILDHSWYDCGITDDNNEISVKFTECDVPYFTDNLVKYNTIKHRTAGFCIYTDQALKQIIDLEKSSEIKTRPKLFIRHDVTILDLDELVKLFRVQIMASARTIAKFYMVKYSLAKIADVDREINMIFKTKTGKFSVFQNL